MINYKMNASNQNLLQLSKWTINSKIIILKYYTAIAIFTKFYIYNTNANIIFLH